MNVVLGLMVYRDAQLIEGCMQNLIDHVDKVVIMNGRIRWLPPQPDDGTDDIIRRICEEHKKPVVFDSTVGNSEQIENALFKYVDDGDYCFVLSARMWAEGDVAGGLDYIRHDGWDAYKLRMSEIDDTTGEHRDTERPLIFRYRTGYSWKENHWTLRDKNDQVVLDIGGQPGKGIEMKRHLRFWLVDHADDRAPITKARRALRHQILRNVAPPHVTQEKGLPTWQI